MFVVQVRDIETHEPLPGIEIGDISTKIAFTMNDNGYLIFKGYKTGKEALLSKFITLDDNGEVKLASPAAKKLSYGGMLKLRCFFVGSVGYCLAREATVVSRYSVLRRQFPNKEGGG